MHSIPPPSASPPEGHRVDNPPLTPIHNPERRSPMPTPATPTPQARGGLSWCVGVLLALTSLGSAGAPAPAFSASLPQSLTDAPAASTDLQQITSWQGPLDTLDGSTLTPRANAPFAEPSLMVGPKLLQLAVDWNVGTYVDPEHGPGHIGNNNLRLSSWLGGTVPLNQGFHIIQPQLLHDQLGDPHHFNRYILLATSNSWKTRQSRLALAVNKYLGTIDYGTPCPFSFDANYLPGAAPTHYY